MSGTWQRGRREQGGFPATFGRFNGHVWPGALLSAHAETGPQHGGKTTRNLQRFRADQCQKSAREDSLLEIKNVIHGAGKWQLELGRWYVAGVRGPVPVGTTPELRHDQCPAQLGCNDECAPHLRQQNG